MNKNFTAIAFIIWLLILFGELFWLFFSPNQVIFIVTFIAVTLIVGTTWFKVFGSPYDNLQ